MIVRNGNTKEERKKRKKKIDEVVRENCVSSESGPYPTRRRRAAENFGKIETAKPSNIAPITYNADEHVSGNFGFQFTFTMVV